MMDSITGDVRFAHRGRRYVLRPSFKTLYAIEQETGFKLPELIARCASLNRQTLRYILQQGTPELPLCIGTGRLRELALRFLISGMGYGAPRVIKSVPALKPIDWRALFMIASLHLKCSEGEFWQMSMHGLLLALEAFAGNELTEAPPTRQELEALMERFPDRGIANDNNHFME